MLQTKKSSDDLFNLLQQPILNILMRFELHFGLFELHRVIRF